MEAATILLLSIGARGVASLLLTVGEYLAIEESHVIG